MTLCLCCVFFFKQKTAYEMRISDWSSTCALPIYRYKGGDSFEEIMLELRETREYKERFPAMQTLRQQGRALTEQQYMQYEQGLRQVLHTFGLSVDRKSGV